MMSIKIFGLACTILTFLMFSPLVAQFDYLQKWEGEGDIAVHFPKGSKVIDKEISDDGDEYTYVVQVQIDGQDWYAIQYTDLPSADPTFFIYCLDEQGKTIQASLAVLSGQKIYFTGNGNIYLWSRANRTADTYLKYRLSKGKIQEVVQPFYYIGLKTHTNKPISLYQSTAYQKKVASLPKNYDVEVVLRKGDENYLVKTSFGLVGWVHLYISPNPLDAAIEGIFFAGD